MIHFEYPRLLYLLLLLIPLVGLWIVAWWRNGRRLERWADKSMFARLVPDRSTSRPWIKTVLFMLAFALLVVALANPQYGTKIEKGKREGGDVAICLDISNSMMAEDIQPNRLQRSKMVITNLMNTLAGDRVSLVLFAGTSYIQLPLTNDYGAAKMFLDQVNCDLISRQGTAIGSAIETAMTSFGYGDEEQRWQKNRGRLIVVISDGENHEDDAVNAARKAKQEGVTVCTIGMGMPDGMPIPERGRHGMTPGFKRDRAGNVVMTRLNEQMLQEIAMAGNGVYVRAGSGNGGVDKVASMIEKLEKEEYGEAVFSAYESRFVYPLAASLICLLAELLIFERRNKKWVLFKTDETK